MIARVALLVGLAFGLAGCKKTEPKRELTSPQKETKESLQQLIKLYDVGSDEQWKEAREKILAYGPPGRELVYLTVTATFYEKASEDKELKRARDEFLWLMSRTGNWGFTILMANLAKGNLVVQQWTIDILVRLKDSRVKVGGEAGVAPRELTLFEATREEYAGAAKARRPVAHRLALLRALGMMGPAAEEGLGFAALHEETRSGDWQDRARLMEILRHFDGTEARAALEAGMKDADPGVRMVAARSLRKLDARVRRREAVAPERPEDKEKR